MMAEKIPITEGKKHLLKLARLANQQNKSFTLTKRGKPFAQITPYKEERVNKEKTQKNYFGCMKMEGVEIYGDLLAPIGEDLEWTADSENILGEKVIFA